MRQKGIRHTVI